MMFVICHPQADTAAIQPACDQTHTYLSNGDDGFCLAQGTETSYTLLGLYRNMEFNPDPGNGWAVAGISNGTKIILL